MDRRCTVVFDTLSNPGIKRTYVGKGYDDRTAIQDAKDQCYSKNFDDIDKCSRYNVLDCNTVSPPPSLDPFDSVEEIYAPKVDLKLRRLRNGFLRYSIGGKAWQDIAWDSSQTIEVKDMDFNIDPPSDGPFPNLAMPLIPLIVIGGDDTLLFKYIDFTTGSDDLNKQLSEFKYSKGQGFWDYFRWPNPGNGADEAMKAQSIQSLTWNGTFLRVTVTAGDGRTCATEMKTRFAFGDDPGLFSTGWSCS